MLRYRTQTLALFTFAILLTAFGAIAAEAPVANADLSVTLQGADLDVELTPETQAQAAPLSFETPLEAALNAASYECPPYTTYCSRDRQCDGFCGGVGAGACEFGCCRCSF